MKTIQILIAEDPDDGTMEDIEDSIEAAMSSYVSKWNYTVTVHDGVR